MKAIPYLHSVQEIGESPHYKNIVAKVQSLSPVVPTYDYFGASNIEEIKFKLAQKSMHDLVMSILKGKVE